MAEQIIKPDRERGRNATFWMDDKTRDMLTELADHYAANKSSTITQLVQFAHSKMKNKGRS